jgi:flavin-dependent thymidylate synthase
MGFSSAAPIVKLVSAFPHAFDNAVATARTCYSPRGIISAEEVARKPEARDRLARSIFEAGHHTTLQHAHFQFSLENVSRHFLWSFLHAHPYYNSEQVSQRYVEVKPGTYAVPPLTDAQRAVYEEAALAQIAAYQRLIEALTAPAAREYYRLFPARAKHESSQKDVKKKAQEVARYVLPVSTFAYLYHTVSGITLLRYWRLCEQLDAPAETRLVVGAMVDELLRHDPEWRTVLEEPLPLDETPEYQFFVARTAEVRREEARALRREFDRELDGRVSKLVDRKPGNEAQVAQAAREVLGAPRSRLSDEEALCAALSPRENPLFGETMNVLTLSKLSRALVHASYTFRKKLSHAADSQDQRHRMTPASRPVLTSQLDAEPDYVVPELVRRSAAAEDIYVESMARTWRAIGRLLEMGASEEAASYLLPNATAIRFTESADLLNLHHKLKSRLCYNAQEEIWRASLDEARQIREVEPTIGKFLLPPCGLRLMTTTRPLCPEGERYCGVPVWKLSLADYSRVI